MKESSILSGVKKRTNETMDTEKRYPREPRIIYLFDLNNKSEDESSLLLSLSFSFFFRTSIPLARIILFRIFFVSIPKGKFR